MRLPKTPALMGILNATPDSFYDGGMYPDVQAQIDRALAMEDEGAWCIDVGGESTRPGATPVSADEELKRVIPVIEGIRKKSKIPISIDTTKAIVAAFAIEAGAGIINDVSGLQADTEMISVACAHQVPVILMHSRGNPQTMQDMTQYGDVVDDVTGELGRNITALKEKSLCHDKILVDPGFSFAKTAEQNWELLKHLGEFKSKLGFPLVVGLSRKSFLGKISNQPRPHNRLYGSLAANLIAAMAGADILRVHDVGPMRDALQVWRQTL